MLFFWEANSIRFFENPCLLVPSFPAEYVRLLAPLPYSAALLSFCAARLKCQCK